MRCTKELCEVQKQYKVALQQLLKRKDLESIFFLRIMMETGMRPNDVYSLKPSEIINRKITKITQKYNILEEHPLISKRAEQIARVLLMNRSYFFRRSRDIYMMRIRKSFSDASMKLYYLRQYRQDMEDIIIKKYKSKRKAAC